MGVYLPLGMMTLETEGNTAFLNDPHRRQLLIVARRALQTTLARANAVLASIGRQLVKDSRATADRRAPRTHASAAETRRGPNRLFALAALFLYWAASSLRGMS
jgi:hypothetical protein